MKKFVIKGPTKGVKGTIVISGAKNSCLPIMASSILFNKENGFSNKPIIAISLYGFIGHYALIWLVNIF